MNEDNFDVLKVFEASNVQTVDCSDGHNTVAMLLDRNPVTIKTVGHDNEKLLGTKYFYGDEVDEVLDLFCDGECPVCCGMF